MIGVYGGGGDLCSVAIIMLSPNTGDQVITTAVCFFWNFVDIQTAFIGLS
jgi:hypothetical protein